MAKRKSSINTTDVKRAVAAISDCGLEIYGITFTKNGSIYIATAANNGNEIPATDVTPYEGWKSNRESRDANECG